VRGRYRAGYKFCSYCRTFVKTRRIRCEKCKRALRSRPRKNQFKRVTYVDLPVEWGEM